MALKHQMTRFDARLSQEQKELFERAAILAGFKSLTEFIVSTVQSRAKKIIRDNERIIASEKDMAIFFEALVSPPEPNKALSEALSNYNAASQG